MMFCNDGTMFTLQDWANHLMRLEDPRFREHPTFVFMVTNMLLRHQCLDIGHVVYKKSTESMTLRELQERLAEEDQEILKNLRYHARNIEGSSQYFHYKNNENLAFNEHLRYSSNDTRMFNLFQTFSFADMHAPDLHRLLPGSDEYLSKIVVENEQKIPPENPELYITKKQDFMLRAANVNRNAMIAVDFFAKRVQTFIEEVMVPTMGVTGKFLQKSNSL